MKDIVIPMTNTAGDANALEAALAIANGMGAHLSVLELINLPVPTPGPWGLSPDAALSQVYTELRAMAQSRAAGFREKLSRDDASSEVRVVESLFVNPEHTAALHARYADMAVMTSCEDNSGDGPVIRSYFSGLLLESGRPVMIVPPNRKLRMPLRHVVIGWRPTKEATRAIHDAMPFLRQADSIDVVEIGASAADMGDGSQPGADIAAHLARHGLKVNVVVREQRGENATVGLLRHCDQSGAQLLVVGGYGHSRFMEWALGGVTRELLQFAHLPVLFSH